MVRNNRAGYDNRVRGQQNKMAVTCNDISFHFYCGVLKVRLV